MGQQAVTPLPLTVSPACPDGRRVNITVNVGELSYPVSFLVGSPSAIFWDDFSSGTDGWSFSGGAWGLTGNAHSAPYSLTDSPSGEYGDNVDAYATIDGSFDATELRFWHRYDIEDGYDYGRVEISVGGGAWQAIQSYDGTQNSWQEVSLDLTPYTQGQPVRVRFHLDTDYYVTEDGWYIDDVMLLGASSENALPDAPVLLAPADGVTIDGAAQLTVANVIDPDGDDVTYGFRVYGDAGLSQLVASTDGVPAGDGGETSWTASLAQGQYHWRAYAADPTAWGQLGEVRTFTVGTTTGADGVVIGMPRLAVLGTGGSQAELQLNLPMSTDVSVKIYNARGALVRDLFSGRVTSGARSLVWDGRDGAGRQASSGTYFVRVNAGGRGAERSGADGALIESSVEPSRVGPDGSTLLSVSIMEEPALGSRTRLLNRFAGFLDGDTERVRQLGPVVHVHQDGQVGARERILERLDAPERHRATAGSDDDEIRVRESRSPTIDT